MRIDELRGEMLHGFSDVQARREADRQDFEDHRKAMQSQFDQIRAEIRAEGETTRRHFDIMAERMADSVKIVAEATAHHATRIDNHEKRLKQLERPRRR